MIFAAVHARIEKVGENKIVGRNMFGDKSLLIIQANYIIKAVKDETMPKWQKSLPTSWLLSPPLYTKSGGKTIDAASGKKALAMSLPIFKPKDRMSSS